MSSSSAEALCTLTQNCERANLVHVRVSGNIEAAGWAALAKALSLASVSVSVSASRELAREGRRVDHRTIWEALQGGWDVDDTSFDKSRGEEGWEALKQALDWDRIQEDCTTPIIGDQLYWVDLIQILFISISREHPDVLVWFPWYPDILFQFYFVQIVRRLVFQFINPNT